MEEWKEYKIKDLLLIPIRNGLTKPSAIRGKGVKMIGMKEIFAMDIIKSVDMERVPVTDRELISTEILQNDLLFARQSLSLEGAGKCSIVSNVNEPTVFESHLIRLRIDEKKANPYYIYYYFKSSVGRIQVQALVQQVAAAGIRGKELIELAVKLPPISTQSKVVSILKSLDDKIEVNRRKNENLEQQAQSLFKSWFVDFEPFKDGEFVESELGMIPKGWKVGTLNELCSFISRGLTPKYDETSEELILGQTCVRNNIVTLNNARKHRPKAKNDKWVQQWDVLLNSTGIGSLGRVGIVYFNMDNVAIDSHITVVRTSCPLYRHYVGRNLLSRQLEIENMAVGSTGQTELPRDRVKAMPIIIPSHDVMDKFNAIIEPMAISMYSNIIESRRLAELRDTLLPKLMSGEIKVLHTDLINEMLDKGIR